MSKPIQILAMGNERKDLIALCDDGSIWQKGEYAQGWRKLPEVRQQTEQEVDQEIERAIRLGDALSSAIHGGNGTKVLQGIGDSHEA